MSNAAASPTFEEQVESERRYCDELEKAKDQPWFFSTFDPDWLLAYKRHVVKWAHCAPEGAKLLPAPFQGWDGKPMGERHPQGPRGNYCRNIREARVRRGLHPLTGQRIDPREDRDEDALPFGDAFRGGFLGSEGGS